MALKTYLKQIIRQIFRNKVYTVLNSVGLSIGFVIIFAIAMYSINEFGYEKSFDEIDQVYRVNGAYLNKNNEKEDWAFIPPAIGPALKETFAEIESSTRILPSYTYSASVNQNSFKCENLYFADKDFFSIFNYTFKYGNPQTALNDINTVVLTHEFASVLFGEKNPVGELVELYSKRGKIPCKVTGVLAKNQGKSHLKFNCVASYASIVAVRGARVDKSWGFSRVYAYVKLNSEATIHNVKNGLDDFFKQNAPAQSKGFGLSLIPAKKIHLYSNMQWDTKNGDAKTVYWLAIIGMIVLVMAWINYINISTSGALDRQKSLAVSRILGAGKSARTLILLLEAIIFNTISLLLSVVIFIIVNPLLLSLTGNVSFIDNPTLAAAIIGLIFLSSTIITGVLPAFSALAVSLVLSTKNKAINSNKAMTSRRILTIVQFAAAIILISGTIIIVRQFNYMESRSLGYRINDKLILSAPVVQAASGKELYNQSVVSFKEELLKIPGVDFVTSSYSVPGGEVPWSSVTRKVGGEVLSVGVCINMVDYDFFNSYQFNMLSGRGFSRDFVSENKGVVLNKMAIELLGLTPETAVGELVFSGNNPHKIIGVIDNFHQQSLKAKYQPFIFYFEELGKYSYTVGVSKNTFSHRKAELNGVWKKHFPNDPFTANFLDDRFEAQYKEDNIFREVFFLFSIISIIITSLGIFALSVATSHKRTKEIGVRKVNGAKVSEILSMLNKDFIKWVAIAFVLACPIAYYAMNKWLENFAYKTTLSWWIFALAGVMALGIALLTVSFQSWKAAIRNPIESLRYE